MKNHIFRPKNWVWTYGNPSHDRSSDTIKIYYLIEHPVSGNVSNDK